jgi:hypothetical protein
MYRGRYYVIILTVIWTMALDWINPPPAIDSNPSRREQIYTWEYKYHPYKDKQTSGRVEATH